MIKRISYLVVGLLSLGGAAFLGAEAGILPGKDSDMRLKYEQRREEVKKLRSANPVKKNVRPLAAVMGGSAKDKQLYGFHCASDFDSWNGVVEIGSNGYKKVSAMSDPVFSAAYMGNMALVAHYQESNYVTYAVYDTNSWERKSQVNYTLNSPNVLPYGMAYDKTTDVVYTFVFPSTPKWLADWLDADESVLAYITNDAAEPTKIVGSTSVKMRAMACDKKGQLYAMGIDGGLYKVNKFSAEIEKVCDVDLPTEEEDGDPYSPWVMVGRESLVFDPDTNDAYFSYCDDYFDTFIAKIDLETGKATMVGNYSYNAGGDQNIFTGLYFVDDAPVVGDATPNAVTDLTVTPVGTELKAEVTFTAPTQDSAGNALTGTLNYRVTNGTNDLATGTTTPGAVTNATAVFSAGGTTNVVVYVSKDGVESNPVFQTVFIGPDEPVISRIPTVRVSGRNATIRWNEAYAKNNGNLAPVHYEITRMPDNVVVTNNCITTTFTDQVESEYKTRYVYIVKPVAGDVAGVAVETRGDYIGDIFAMPHENDFTDAELFLQYPVIDNNKDKNTWDINVQRNAAVYASNSNDADDYLLVGPFRMSPDNIYTFSANINGHNIAETFAVYVGTDPEDVSSFSTEIVPETRVFPMQGAAFVSENFTPAANGNYYFAIKACSSANTQYLYVYDVSVRESSTSTPDAPVFTEIVPSLTTATLKFTLPDKCINGNALTEITEVRLYRDGVYIARTSDGVAPGAELEFTDEATVKDGTHRYSVSAVNSQGEGRAAETTLYRGLDCPGSPTSLRMWEDLNTPGLIHITFKAPERGYRGGYVNKDEITYLLDYMVMGQDANLVTLGAGTEHTFQLPFDVTKQDLFAGSIYGSNYAGAVRSTWTTNICMFGPAIPLPVQESWSGMTQTGGLWAGQDVDDGLGLQDGIWEISDGTGVPMRPQDNDGGMVAMMSTEANSARRLLSPRITLEGTEHPTLVFYYNTTDLVSELYLEVMEEDQPLRVLRDLNQDRANEGKWVRCEVALDEFKGKKYIELAFVGRGKAQGCVAAIDNVTICDYVDYDLAVKEFTCPTRCEAGETVEMTLKVRNNGGKKVASGAYSVELYKNDVRIDVLPGLEIEPSSELVYNFSDVLTVADNASTTYFARIVYDQDMVPANNESKHCSVRVIVPNYPAVTDLVGVPGHGVELSWSDPTTTDMPGVPTIESFEAYTPFIINNIGDWTLYDVDNKPTVTLALSTGVLNYEHIGEPMAWQVMNTEDAGIYLTSWTPRTGYNMLVSFQACIDGHRDVNSEDWLVSPELNGAAQTISFYAQTAGSEYSPELFDFMVSSTGNAMEDFTVLAADQKVNFSKSDDWNEFRYDVPAGTRYFAIVHKSYNMVAMLVDDITYIPAGSATMQLELQGFNVYRDGARINDEPVVENDYNDTNVEEGKDYAYAVTALWDKGESPVSNVVVVRAASSIDGAKTATLRIVGGKGEIKVEGGDGQPVSVHSISGVRVAETTADGTVSIPVASGIYVVRAGNHVAKIAVK